MTTNEALSILLVVIWNWNSDERVLLLYGKNANDWFITYIYNKETNKDVTKLDCNKLLMKMSVRHKMSLYVICNSNSAIRHAHSDMQ